MRKTKVEQVIELMKDGKPRDLEEIRRELSGLSGLSQIVSHLFRNGTLLASDIIHVIELKEEDGRWKYSRKRKRWYIIANGRTHVNHEVTYQIFDRKRMRNKTVTQTLTFKPYSQKKKTNISKRVYEYVATSKIALFPPEVAKHLKISTSQAVRALFDHWRYGRLKRAGWFNPETGTETRFHKGWLYYKRLSQLEERIKKHDLLPEGKQRIYDYVLRNTKIQHRLTPKREICEELKYPPKLVAQYTKEISAVYNNFKEERIGGETFYYISGHLTEEELAKQREYWSSGISEKRSFKNLLGHAHEQFVQIGLDEMWNRGDFKIKDYFWEFTITRDGKKKYQVYKSKAGNPSKLYEFDRVLHCILGGPKEREIILVFEMKYRGDLRKKQWDEFIRKLADTYDFGTEINLKDINGKEVTVRIPKLNVVPVIVIPWRGKDTIDIRIGEETRKVNFAKYVTMQGGIVLFTSEFERYLTEKLGKKIKFKKFFENWFSQNRKQEELTKALLEYIFGSQSQTGSNPNFQPLTKS